MVSAELALAIPVALLVLALCLSGIGLALDHVRTAEAARAGARAAARGETTTAVVALVAEVAPDGSTIHVEIGEGRAVVTVTAPPRGWLPGVPPATATSVGALEPAAGGP